MAKLPDIKGKTALVTGASSGIGMEFAFQLAALGCNLVIVARNEEALKIVRKEITEQYPVEVTVIAADLTQEQAVEKLFRDMVQNKKQIEILINNAGVGVFGEFQNTSWQKELGMLRLDILSVVQLTKLFLPPMLYHKFGYILFVSSVAAFQPCPLYATYAASKSFIQNFGEALAFELSDTPISVTVLAPGVTSTHFHATAGQPLTSFQKMSMMDSRSVVSEGIRALLNKRTSVIPGWGNKILIFIERFLPRKLSTWFAYKFMK